MWVVQMVEQWVVEPQSPVRALVQRLLEGLSGGVAQDRGQLAGDFGSLVRPPGR